MDQHWCSPEDEGCWSCFRPWSFLSLLLLSFRCLRLGDISGKNLSDVLSWCKHTVCPFSSQLILCERLSVVLGFFLCVWLSYIQQALNKKSFKLNLIQGCCSFSGSWMFQLERAERGLVHGAEMLRGAQRESVQAPVCCVRTASRFSSFWSLLDDTTSVTENEKGKLPTGRGRCWIYAVYLKLWAQHMTVVPETTHSLFCITLWW